MGPRFCEAKYEVSPWLAEHFGTGGPNTQRLLYMIYMAVGENRVAPIIAI